MFGNLGEGGGLSFRDEDVVPFTFDLDFLEGLSVGSRLWMKAEGKPYRTGRGNEEY